MATKQLLQGVDSLADRLGLLRRPLSNKELLKVAQRRTGLCDFGELPIVEPLQILLEACAKQASLSLVGRVATRWDVIRFLTNLLTLREQEYRVPAILEQPIDKPVIITGLPRSGTTFLHRLMMEDPANRAPLVWETIYPYPLKQARDRRVERVARQLRAFEWLAPEFRDLHPLHAHSPQECSEITAHVFRSLRFDTTYHIPSYRAWLEEDEQGHLSAYRFHKRFLQHLQYQHSGHSGPPRWVLKCPDHLFALDAIRQVYPDARVILVHRDPVKVLLSVAKLTEVLRQPFTRRINRVEIGQQESARWLEGTRRMMATADMAGLPEPICHVHYLDLVSDPVGTVTSVYRHFGLGLPAGAAQAMKRRVASEPGGGYGPRAYEFQDHGLEADAEREKFRPYMLRFGVSLEPLPIARPRRRTPAIEAPALG
ncbi:MAG: sulfotransferase [Acetobacteraceae bacterium]|nr:sulfotransferase [Acetobacteraceae bacterium]